MQGDREPLIQGLEKHRMNLARPVNGRGSFSFATTWWLYPKKILIAFFEKG
jgi:hypothetical protein